MFKNIENRKYKLLFLGLLFLLPTLASFEFVFATLFIIALILINQRKLKISGNLLTGLLSLLIILFIGLTITTFYAYNFVDISKDIAYFSKPILILFIGYALIQSIDDELFLFRSFIYLAIIFAFIHLYKLFTYPQLFSISINKLRTDTGLSNDVELLAFVFLLLGFKYPKMKIFQQSLTTKIVLTLLFISFFLYFSRTMWLALFLLLLTAFGYAKISLKALKYIAIVLLIIGGFYIYLFSIEINRNDPGISSFLYKMKIAPEEIFLPKIDLNNHAALWDHWRAYEAQMAFNQTKGFQHIVGHGFGSLVDLQFKAPLNDEGMRYISHLHNGYALVYYKTGLVGVLFYMIFLLHLYLFTFYKKNIQPDFPITNLIAAMGVYLLFSTLIISGAYNLRDVYLFALGGFFALYDKPKLIKTAN